ncbi:MAG: hypothetical protein JWM11_2456 [Planctomycetaceae bacterium]|nr:hypothetical protein [Planctomycetaceae bacterium]
MNPFREGIVASPWEATGVDVNSIHDDVFQECLRGIERVRRGHRTASLLIHGEAGSGKTHLLKRLRARLTPQVPPDTDREDSLYVWVRLQTSPRMIWRTVRRTLVEDWFRPVPGVRSQFERILFHRLAEIRVANGDLERWYEYMLDEVPAGLKELMDQIADSLHLDRNTAVAFEHIAFRRHLRDLRAWLAGDSLPEAALARMDLSQDEGTDEERESLARQVVLMLCRLAGDTLPILISFDQVEALQLFPGDRDALYAFGQVTSTLHDGTNNVFVVSCVQSAFFNELKDHARQADYDRMTSVGALSLEPLSRLQAEQLITARMDEIGDSNPKPDAAAPTWPLNPREFSELFSAGFVTPRKLLGYCAERFEVVTRAGYGELPLETASTSTTAHEESTPTGLSVAAARAAVVTEFLNDKWDNSCEEKLGQSAPEKTEDIVRHGLPLLIKLITPQAKLTRDELLQDVALIYEINGELRGVSICTQSNMTSLAAVLKRLKSQLGTQKLQRLVVVRDKRVPLSTTAKVAKKLMDELEQDPRTEFAWPVPEVLAALDALRALLSDAKSGDLSCHGEAVTQETLEDWLRAHLPDSLRDLADSVVGQPDAKTQSQKSDAHDLEALNTLLGERPVLNVEAAVQALGRTREELTQLVKKYPDQIGLLSGPPEVLFRLVTTMPQKD